VQGLPSLQTTDGVDTHVPEAQWSLVQAFPSEQELVSSFVKTQSPVAGLQESSVQRLLSLQTTTGVPTHAPETHASLVQRFPSEQGFVLSFVYTHWPFAGCTRRRCRGWRRCRRPTPSRRTCRRRSGRSYRRSHPSRRSCRRS